MEPKRVDPCLSERFRANDADLLELCHHFSREELQPVGPLMECDLLLRPFALHAIMAEETRRQDF